MIHVTVPVTLPVRPSKSKRLNTKLPFHPNVYDVDQLLLVTVTPVLLNHVKVATTVPVVIVPDVGTYITLAVGGSGSTVNDELVGPLIVPSLTLIVTHVAD